MKIGIDLGGMSIKAGLVDDELNIVYKETAPTDVNSSEVLCNDIISLILKVREKTDEEITSIGIGIPGDVDKITGKVIYCNNIPLNNFDLRAVIEEKTNIPTFIGNDANVAALGEVLAGAAKEYSDAVLVTIGTGIGCGIVMNNKIYLGCNGAAGELGHHIIEAGGRMCNCGRRGCFELYASATALIRATKEKMQLSKESKMWEIAGGLENVNGKTAFDAYRAGDKAGTEVVEEFITYLAAGLVNVVNIFQPDALIIGGGISKEGQFLLDLVSPIIERERYSRGDVQTKLLIAELGNDAGIIGASQLS